MDLSLGIQGIFSSEAELRDVIAKRRICYDTEPYYIPDKKGGMTQIGYRLNLYGTFPDPAEDSPDDKDFGSVLRDVRRVAEALSQACGAHHMCESEIIDSTSVSYSASRKMRPDIEVHIPVFDQKNFGHEVDARIRSALELAGKMLENAGVRKNHWD